MKIIIRNLLAAMLLVAGSLQTHAQGTLVYDQESATGPTSPDGIDFLNIQDYESLTQSFVPELSAIGFVQLEFTDVPNNGNNGATVYVNLYEGSPTPRLATLIASTVSVYMPNGFGETTAGVSTFDFLSAVTLNPGDTYYIEPVVQSGDNPWDVMVLGNTGSFTDAYPAGELYVNGSPVTGNVDFWFREGIVAVPEPTTLALIGFSGLLAFAFKRRSKLPVLIFACSLFTVPILSVHAATDSVVQVTADAAGLTPVSATALPHTGTFWVMTINPNNDRLTSLPFPFLPPDLSDMPTYWATNDTFIVDDTGGQLAPSSTGRMSDEQAASTAQAQTQTMADLVAEILYPPTPGGSGGTNEPILPAGGFIPMFDTNGLWLEASNEAPNIGLRLHNPVSGDNYQLLSTPDLLNTNWDLGQIWFGASGDYIDFSNAPMTNTMTFFRVHQANPAMEITSGQPAIEPIPTNSDPGQVGIFNINNEWYAATNDITVYYTMSGTAQNGIDYSNLTGSVVLPANQNQVQITFYPIADGLKPDQTVIFSLIQNTNYLIDPANVVSTNILYANPEVYPDAFGDTIPNICPNSAESIQLGASDPLGLTPIYTILTWPSHGMLNTNGIPNCTYSPTNCYEGNDSFTFDVTEGAYTSSPATVTLGISDPITVNPINPQTCRGTPVSFSLGSDNCGETLSYALLSAPAYGTLTGTVANLTYTPNDTNFTGTDTFNYVLYSGCGGDSATNTITITVGDVGLQANSQNVMTGTNQPVAIALSVSDFDSCHDDTNYYTYTITSNPANGTLSGSGANLIYTPTNGFEGMDSFQFAVSDGVGAASTPATVTLFVVAGPILTTTCNPFGTAAELNWSLDTNVQQMVYQDGLGISDFIIYRSTNSGVTYTAIATNAANQMNYFDTNTVIGQPHSYVVNFESSESGITCESARSDEVEASSQNPDNFISANAFWEVATNLSNLTNVVRLQAPFSCQYPAQYQDLFPLPNSNWTVGTTQFNSITLYIPTNTDLSQVQYSIAIDNDYWLYLNNSSSPIDTTNSEGYATWLPFKSFNSVAPGLLHYGTNSVGVLIVDEGQINYFSMVVTTNTCGQ